MSGRKAFVGAHITPAAKAAMRAQAKQLHLYASEWMSMAILEKLERAGVDLLEYEECNEEGQ